MIRETHLSTPLRMTMLCTIAGGLVVGCGPPAAENDNEQLSRAQEAPLREDQNQQDREAASSPAPAQREPNADAAAAAAELSGGEPMRARAVLQPTRGSQVSGMIEFEPRDDGSVMISAEIDGLEPGQHGFHIHQSGDCSAPDASSAGEHFAPDDAPHGSPEDAPSEHHAGDLGNVNADDGGMADARIVDEELELVGETGVVGRAVIVHENRDDLESQPSGDAGDRVACGVVRMLDETKSRQRDSRG